MQEGGKSLGEAILAVLKPSGPNSKADRRRYIAGGQGPNIWTLTLVERYDPVADTWETLAP